MRRLLFILSCLFLAVSCSYTPEEMVEDYNKNFSPTDGPQEPGKEYYLPDLLEYDNYYIMPHSYEKIYVKSAYVEYVWTLTGEDGTEYDLGHAYWTAHIDTKELNMAEGVYTLRLRVKNRLGIYYYDTAKVRVEDY